MNDNDREAIIRAAIVKAKANGITIVPQKWGLEWSKLKSRFTTQKDNSCCILSCVLLAEQDKLARVIDWKIIHIEDILQVNLEWIRDFQVGFDGLPKLSTNEDGAYELGVMMQAEKTTAAGTNTQLNLL